MKVNRKIIDRLLRFSAKTKKERVKGFTTNDFEMFIAFQNNVSFFDNGDYKLCKN